jgi:hypothetical protein
MQSSLTDLVTAADSHKGSWRNVQLAQDVKDFLWAAFDPHDDLTYPTVAHWDLLLMEAMTNDKYDNLSRSEVLSALFGIMHRTRISEGVWESLFSRGVIQKLLAQLLRLDTDKC